MNEGRIEALIQRMAERWQTAYNNVQPDQAYPIWFDETQLGWIRDTLRDEDLSEGGRETLEEMFGDRGLS